MPPQTQILITDKIKAWAFPILLSIVSIFMYHFFQQQNTLIETQAKQEIQNALILYRLGQIDKDIDELHKNLK